MKKYMLALILLLSVVYVGLFVGIGSFSHPAADDYSFYEMTQKHGFIGAQSAWYTSWTGRFSNNFFVSLFTLTEFDNIYPWLSFIFGVTVFLLILLSVVFLLKEQVSSLTAYISISFFIFAIWFMIVSGLNENFYLLSGFPYFLSCAVLFLEVACLHSFLSDREKFPQPYFVLLIILCIINSSFFEIAAVAQIMLFALVSMFYIYDKNYSKALSVFVVAIISVLSLGVVFFSPGTSVRTVALAAGGGVPRNILRTIQIAFFAGGHTTLEFFTKPVIYTIFLFVPFFSEKIPQLSFVKKLPFRLRLWHIIAFEILTACGFQAIGGYAMGGALPPRAVGTVIWIMSAQWIFFFMFCYRNADFVERVKNWRIFRWRVVLLASCFMLNTNFLSLINDYSLADGYSQQLNDRYAFISEQKAKENLDVIVPKLTTIPKLLFFADITETVKDWKNESYAAYFGLNTIRALPLELLDVARGKDAIREAEKAIELADAGELACQLYLAKLYDPRIGDFANDNVPKNEAIALKWYIKVAEQDDDNAMQRMLGGFYRRGFGTPDGKPDYLAAAKWYLLSMW